MHFVIAPRRAVGVERVWPILARGGSDARAPVLAGVFVEVLAQVLLVVVIAEQRRPWVAPVGPELARLLDRVGIVDLRARELSADEPLEAGEDAAALAVPPLAVGVVEIGTAIVAVVVDVSACDVAPRVLIEASDRTVVEAHRHGATVANPHAEEVRLAEVGLNGLLEELLQIPERFVIRQVNHAVVDIALVGEEVFPARVLGGAERPGLEAVHVADARRSAGAVVFVERKDRDILRGKVVDDLRPVVRRVAPAGIAREVLLVAELEKILGACVHAEQANHLGAALVEVLRMREASEVVSVAHFLARGDDAARQALGRIRDRRARHVVAVNLVEADRRDRESDRVGRLARLDDAEVEVEAVGVHRDAVVAAVVLLRLLERHHDLDELLRLARIRYRPRLDRLRDVGGRPRVARRPARVIAVARGVAEVEDRDGARRFVRVVDDEHVGFVRDDALALADTPRDIAARVALMVHHARRYVEDVLHGGPVGWILAEHVVRIVRERKRAVDFVHERERTVVFKAGDDLVC